MTDCYYCGKPVTNERIYRTSLCLSCGRELKICYNCRFYDAASPASCREPVPEEVRDKDRANFCDQFSPGANAMPRKGQAKSPSGRQAFGKLFGDD
jgi:hypothetical protein